MKVITTFSFLLFFLSFTLLPAQKYDYQWPFGYGSNFDNGFGISLLDFNNQAITTTPYFETDLFELEDVGSFICDEEGNLVLMTNNCELYTPDLEVVEGSEVLAPGEIYDEYCINYWGYIGEKLSLLLPEFTNDSTYYLLNKDLELSDALQDALSKNFYFRTITQREDGSFYVKNAQTLFSGNMNHGLLTACRHHNEQQWWTFTMDYESNQFEFFLIGGDSMQLTPTPQNIGPIITHDDMGSASVAFSPNTEYLAIGTLTRGIMLYDFDNQTGLLSNYRNIPFPNQDVARGVVFSPSSRFIYVTTPQDIYQIDLEEPNPEEQVFHLGEYFSYSETGWPVSLGDMYIGPDCRIYVSPASTCLYIHTIHSPNEKGMACNFEERAIRTPTRVTFNIPNIPMYRFDGQCDNSIEWGIVSTDEIAIQPIPIHIYPNPAIEQITLSLPSDIVIDHFVVYDILGRQIHHQRHLVDNTSIPVSSWHKGMFFYQAFCQGKIVASGKFEKL